MEGAEARCFGKFLRWTSREKVGIDMLQTRFSPSPGTTSGLPMRIHLIPWWKCKSGMQGLQAVNTVEFVVRSLRGWAVPPVTPIAQAWKAFDGNGVPQDVRLVQLRRKAPLVAKPARKWGTRFSLFTSHWQQPLNHCL